LIARPNGLKPAFDAELMTRLLQAASAAALILTASLVVGSTAPGFAQDVVATVPAAEVAPVIVELPSPAVLVEAPAAPEAAVPVEVPEPAAPAPVVPARAASLSAMVRAVAHAEPENAQLRCLANGVYFESNGESLEGQLAVAHVIINRARSGRFASSYCGVLTQRSQFSFVRGGTVPQAPRNAGWHRAVAIARIAEGETWRNPAPGALFFHAARVSPGWNRPRVAQIDNHIFYR
jgi:spore germination cell wall hydrolase CwlJ-like protein